MPNGCQSVSDNDARRHQPLLNLSIPGQNGRRFADDSFRCIFVNENFVFWLKFLCSLFLIGNNPALLWIMAWRQPDDNPLSEPMTVSLRTYIFEVIGIHPNAVSQKMCQACYKNIIANDVFKHYTTSAMGQWSSCRSALTLITGLPS